MLRFRLKHLLIAQLIVCLFCANIRSIKTYNNHLGDPIFLCSATVCQSPLSRWGMDQQCFVVIPVFFMATNTPVYLREEWILKLSNEGEDEFGPNYKVMFEIIWGGSGPGEGEGTNLWVGYRDSNDDFNWLPWGH